MQYHYTTKNRDWSALASGQVLYSRPGLVGFPIRLASELFQRCSESVESRGGSHRHTIYDPCCGAGNLLTSIGVLHRDVVQAVVGSDIDANVLEVCAKNLKLLSKAGLHERIDELRQLHQTFGKPQHQSAALAAEKMYQQDLPRTENSIVFSQFRADATDLVSVKEGLRSLSPDIIITDLPYGVMTHPTTGAGISWEEWCVSIVNTISEVTTRPAAIAIVAQDRLPIDRLTIGHWRRLKLGKRHIVFGEL